MRDGRFVDLLWRILKAGHIDRGLFAAASEGVPQGGVLSPLLSNIMLHEFDAWLEAKSLNRKVRKDRWAWNFGIQQGRSITVHENRQWRPAVAYCRYADDFIVIVKGTKVHAMEIREECRAFLEGRLKLTLNMEKSHITHVNDGFVFLGHRIIRKRGSNGRMSVVTTIPKEKAKAFVRKLIMTLSGNHDVSTVDMMDCVNRQLAGWAAFYKFTDFTARTFRRIDHVVFWKLAHWLGRKYRSRIKPLMRSWYRAPKAGQAKTWLVYGRNEQGTPVGKALRRMVSSHKAQFRWRNPERIRTSSGTDLAAPSRHAIMMLPWPWAKKLEWRAVCAERRTYGSGRRSGKPLLTPLPVRHGFMYLVAIMDWATRHVLAWRVSNTLDASFCTDALDAALERFGKPEFFNTDQGSQFTGHAFTGRLRAAEVKISMDGRGRCLDSVFIERLWRSLKYEAVYLHDLADGFEAERVINAWMVFYNTERPHSALAGRTPAEAYRGEQPVDMMDKPLRALTTSPQAQQQQVGYTGL